MNRLKTVAARTVHDDLAVIWPSSFSFVCRVHTPLASSRVASTQNRWLGNSAQVERGILMNYSLIQPSPTLHTLSSPNSALGAKSPGCGSHTQTMQKLTCYVTGLTRQATRRAESTRSVSVSPPHSFRSSVHHRLWRQSLSYSARWAL